MKIEKCPFCGGEAAFAKPIYTKPGTIPWGIIQCTKCSAEITSQEGNDQAAAAWNRRAKPENARQRALQAGICPMCEDCPDGCPIETPKDSRNIVTNADRIRSMSDKELAEFLRNIRDCGDYEELKFIGGVCMDYVSVIEWLKQPAKEE